MGPTRNVCMGTLDTLTGNGSHATPPHLTRAHFDELMCIDWSKPRRLPVIAKAFTPKPSWIGRRKPPTASWGPRTAPRRMHRTCGHKGLTLSQHCHASYVKNVSIRGGPCLLNTTLIFIWSGCKHDNMADVSRSHKSALCFLTSVTLQMTPQGQPL